jgi:protein-L-isoaspartate(D-aspartate) O-methyltransferase
VVEYRLLEIEFSVMTNIAQFNMVEQQIRPWNVQSLALLEAMSALDRSLFVPQAQQSLSYVDCPIQLDESTRMLEPKVVARLVQGLDIKSSDHVLLVGAGSGYTAAVCSRLASTVVCQDTSQVALDRAEKNCALAGINNVGFQKIENLHSATDGVQYDAILLREGMAELPDVCLEKLADKGRCVALLGRNYAMEMICYTREGDEIRQESIIEILTPLAKSNVGSAAVKAGFVF